MTTTSDGRNTCDEVEVEEEALGLAEECWGYDVGQ